MSEQDDFNPFSAPLEIEPAKSKPINGRGPQGIGGWLILVAIGLFVMPFRLAFLLITTHLPLFTTGQFSELTDPQSPGYHPLWGPLLAMEVIGNLLVGAAAVVALVLMFRKSRSFPKWMIGYYAFNLGFVVLDALLSNLIPAVAQVQDPEIFGEIAKSIVVSVIWIPYMCVSQRVKNTFVH